MGRMASSGMLRRVALVRTDVSKDLIASLIRVTRIGVTEGCRVVSVSDPLRSLISVF
jgi:hypothetical protein